MLINLKLYQPVYESGNKCTIVHNILCSLEKLKVK